MGEYLHTTIIVTGEGSDDALHNDMQAFRDKLPWNVVNHLLGPLRLHNGFCQYILMASGGKEGGGIEDDFAPFRRELMERYRHRAIKVRYGDQAPPAVTGWK